MSAMRTFHVGRGEGFGARRHLTTRLSTANGTRCEQVLKMSTLGLAQSRYCTLCCQLFQIQFCSKPVHQPFITAFQLSLDQSPTIWVRLRLPWDFIIALELFNRTFAAPKKSLNPHFGRRSLYQLNTALASRLLHCPAAHRPAFVCNNICFHRTSLTAKLEYRREEIPLTHFDGAEILWTFDETLRDRRWPEPSLIWVFCQGIYQLSESSIVWPTHWHWPSRQ